MLGSSLSDPLSLCDCESDSLSDCDSLSECESLCECDSLSEWLEEADASSDCSLSDSLFDCESDESLSDESLTLDSDSLE